MQKIVKNLKLRPMRRCLAFKMRIYCISLYKGRSDSHLKRTYGLGSSQQAGPVRHTNPQQGFYQHAIIPCSSNDRDLDVVADGDNVVMITVTRTYISHCCREQHKGLGLDLQ
jgi:hypothetical protein